MSGVVSSSLWKDEVPAKNGQPVSINDVAYSPDGSKCIVAAGSRVLLYDANTGELIKSLRGHEDTVYSVDFSTDGSHFASGGADNSVVIWKASGQGKLKYPHSAPIQRVKYNPVSFMLASCSDVDFGLWMPDKKQVPKEKVGSRVVSAAWSSDGTQLALGLLNGTITLRNIDCEETHRIERKAPVWCLAFIPNTNTPSKSGSSTAPVAPEGEMLAAGCWDKTLTFYRILPNGASKAHTERTLKFYPTSITLAGNNAASKNHYLILSGSDKKVSLYSKEGIRLADLATKDTWVWSAAYQPMHERVLMGTHNGQIDVAQLRFETVHSLYREKYAFRENLTDIVIHHLTADRKVRIKCKDIIRRISLYRNKLAVQLSDKVCVYESNAEEKEDMHFRARKERMTISDKQCDMMLVTSEHLIFTVGAVVELYTFEGKRQRVWRMESPIHFMIVDGGPEGKEGLLLGMENGVISKIYVDNPFPVELMKRDAKVICCDASLYRTKVASVDANNKLVVTNLKSQDTVFTAEGVLSVCFNTEVDDMLCYTTASNIYVVSGVGTRGAAPEPEEQHTQGFAVGFQGQRIYCLYRGAVQAIDVPQGMNIQRAIEAGNFESAYAVACFGATETNWRQLANRALRANSLKVAKCAFERLKDVKYLALIESIEGSTPVNAPSEAGSGRGAKLATSNQLDIGTQAELLAYEGHHHEAAKTYARAGRHLDAIRIFTDLKNWTDAKAFAQSSGQFDVSSLTAQQAQWLKDSQDWRGASELYISMGQFMEAAKIIAESADKDWQDKLIELVRQASAEQREALLYCGEAFSNADANEYAKESYQKIGEVSKLVQLYARKKMWVEAGKLVESSDGKFDLSVMLPYAEWLVSQDKYEEAMSAYKKAGRSDLSRKVLAELTSNAVSESRFKDAAYYFWMLAKESEIDDPDQQMLCERKADLYFAYASIHSYIVDPFTPHQPETLFQVARFIINSLGNSEVIPFGISKASTLYTLAKQAMTLGAYKLARYAYDRLSKMQVPATKQSEVELDMLIIQAKPIRDNADVIPVCFRCSASNPLLNPFTSKFAKGDVCTNCGHPFVRSFITFDVLPLVEFVPEPSISDEEAIALIRQPAKGMGKKRSGRGEVTSRGQWNEGKSGGADTLQLDEDYHGASKMSDPSDGDSFQQCVNAALEHQNGAYIAVTVDRSALLAMNRSEVFVCRPSSKNKRATFYRNMLPEIPIAISQPCHRFFHLEDFEFTYLSTRSCPYSRFKSVVVQCSGTNIIDTESDFSSPLDDLRELFESSDKCHALIKSLCGTSCRGTKTDSSKSCWRFCAHAHAEKLREAGCNIPDRKLIIGPSWTWGGMEKPSETKDMGTWQALLYSKEQQARLGVDEWGHSTRTQEPTLVPAIPIDPINNDGYSIPIVDPAIVPIPIRPDQARTGKAKAFDFRRLKGKAHKPPPFPPAFSMAYDDDTLYDPSEENDETEDLFEEPIVPRSSVKYKFNKPPK